MKSLVELQQKFCDALRSPEPPPSELLDEILDDGFALHRFNVYRNNFVLLNGDALGEMYPVVKRLLGDAAFRMLASAYVRDYPPMERNLLLYGEDFPGFISTIPELSELPYLPDVARLEYAWTAAYHSEDKAQLGESEVATVDPKAFEKVGLVPHPSLHCQHSDYPLYRIWAANQSNGSSEQISLDEGGSRVIVIRPAAVVETREVGAGAYLFLTSLQAGDAIGDAYTCASQTDDSFDLGAFFAEHLFDGTFVSIRKINN